MNYRTGTCTGQVPVRSKLSMTFNETKYRCGESATRRSPPAPARRAAAQLPTIVNTLRYTQDQTEHRPRAQSPAFAWAALACLQKQALQARACENGRENATHAFSRCPTVSADESRPRGSRSFVSKEGFGIHIFVAKENLQHSNTVRYLVGIGRGHSLKLLTGQTAAPTLPRRPPTHQPTAAFELYIAARAALETCFS